MRAVRRREVLAADRIAEETGIEEQPGAGPTDRKGPADLVLEEPLLELVGGADERRRRAGGVATTDVLMAVMQVYGADFDRVLRAHGTDSAEVIERLKLRLWPGPV